MRGYENTAKRVPLSPTVRARKQASEKRTLKHMGRILRQHRERRGLSLETMAERAKLTVERLTNFETGQRSPYMDELFQLAGAFKIRASTLLKRMVPELDRLHQKPAPRAIRARAARP